MDDSSIVEFEIMATESFSALGGSLCFASGPCADLDGLYYLLRN